MDTLYKQLYSEEFQNKLRLPHLTFQIAKISKRRKHVNGAGFFCQSVKRYTRPFKVITAEGVSFEWPPHMISSTVSNVSGKVLPNDVAYLNDHNNRLKNTGIT